MDPDLLISVFKKIFESDGLTRKDLESNLLQKCLENPESYLKSSLIIINSYEKIHFDIRLYGVLHLMSLIKKQNLLKFIDSKSFLNDLLILLKNEPHTKILGFLSEILCEVVMKILKKNSVDKEIHQILTDTIWEFFSIPHTNKILSGLNILIKLVEGCLEEILLFFQDNLLTITQQMLLSDDPSILSANIKLITKIMTYAEYSYCKKYIHLMPKMIEILFEFLARKKKEGEDILSDFYEIAESEPKLFKAYFPVVFSETIKIHGNQTISNGVKQQLLELILSLIERIPKSLNFSQPAIENLFQMIFLQMMSIDENIEIDDNFSEESDFRFEAVRFGREAIDRVISSFDGKQFLEVFSIYIQRLLQINDWRGTFSALMGLSQIGEYLEEINEIHLSLQLSLSYLDNPQPMIRYAVCHTLGQLSTDMKPEFQEKYHMEILPSLLNMIHDNNALVASHAAAALSNFIEGMCLNTIKQYLTGLVSELLNCIEQKNGKLKENCLIALKNCCKVARDCFLPYLTHTSDVLLTQIQKNIDAKSKKIRGICIKTLCQIGISVGFNAFYIYFDQVINLLKIIPSTYFEIIDTVLAWNKILSFVPPDTLIKYMDKENWEKVLFLSEFCVENQEDFNAALKLLNSFLEKMNIYLIDHFERLTNLLIPLTSFENAQETRITALKCLPLLVKMLVSNNQSNQAEMFVKGLLDLIFKINRENIDLEIRTQMIKTLIELFKIEKSELVLVKADFQELINLIWQNINSSFQRIYLLRSKRNEDEDIDEDEEQIIDDDIKSEENYLLLMGELLASVFKKFFIMVKTLSVFDTLMSEIFPAALEKGLKKFVLYLLDDLMDEEALMEILKPYQSKILEMFLSNSHEKNCEIRQASLYGLGVFVERFKDVNFDIEIIRNNIIDALKIKKNNESNRSFLLCRDNAISALGKLMKNHSNKINMKQTIQIWLDNFPIKYDIEEAHCQYDMLFKGLNSDPNAIIMDSSDNLEKVFKIIAEIYDTHLINNEIKNLILAFVQTIMNLKNYDFEKFGQRFKEMNSSALKRLQKCVEDAHNIK